MGYISIWLQIDTASRVALVTDSLSPAKMSSSQHNHSVPFQSKTDLDAMLFLPLQNCYYYSHHHHHFITFLHFLLNLYFLYNNMHLFITGCKNQTKTVPCPVCRPTGHTTTHSSLLWLSAWRFSCVFSALLILLPKKQGFPYIRSPTLTHVHDDHHDFLVEW